MTITLISIYSFVSMIAFPALLILFFILFFKWIIYNLKKKFMKGKFFRLFYIAENGQLYSSLIKIGSEYCDEVVEYMKKAFIFDPDQILTLPKKIGFISGEPSLWYRWNHISAVQLKKGDIKECLKPFNPKDLKNNKLPKEFYDALNTKAISDILKPESNINAKELGIGMILVIGLAIGIYLMGKKMGWF